LGGPGHPFPLGGEQVPAIAVRWHRDDPDDSHTETGDDKHRNDQESHVTRVTHVTSGAQSNQTAVTCA
jgi:hypothetical protein